MLKLEKSKEQPFVDLLSLQRNVQKELAAQTRFIKEFQLLAQEEEDLLPMLNLFDCPVAVFERGGILQALVLLGFQGLSQHLVLSTAGP